MITGNSDVPMAVEAMKAGALDFIEKPIGREELIASIERALELSQDSSKLQEWRESAATHLAGLTPRQREVMDRVLAGQPSKNIAADLGISQRTVENHRASIMKRTGSKSLPALARLALVAAGGGGKPRGGALGGRDIEASYIGARRENEDYGPTRSWSRLDEARPQRPQPQRLPQPPPPRTSRRTMSSNTAPIVALTMAAIMPAPRWMLSSGSSHPPMKAPTTPMIRSWISP